MPGRLETILVVDDDEAILKMVVDILSAASFRVLSANSGSDAVKLVEETDEKIHLMLSDVEMPGTSGPDLGQTLKKSRPDMLLMFMSGGDNGSLLVLNYGWAYIQQPFVPTKLIQMVNDVLHSPDRSQGGQEFDVRKDKN